MQKENNDQLLIPFSSQLAYGTELSEHKLATIHRMCVCHKWRSVLTG